MTIWEFIVFLSRPNIRFFFQAIVLKNLEKITKNEYQQTSYP